MASWCHTAFGGHTEQKFTVEEEAYDEFSPFFASMSCSKEITARLF